MKTRPKITWLKMVQLLVPGILLMIQCGCANPGPPNTGQRAWTCYTDLEERDEQRRMLWWGWPCWNAPALENQQAEEWLNRH